MPNMSQVVPLNLNKLSEKKRERMTETPQELRSMLMKGIFACFKWIYSCPKTTGNSLQNKLKSK